TRSTTSPRSWSTPSLPRVAEPDPRPVTAPRPADPARRPYGWWLASRMGGLDRVVGALLAVLTFPLVAVLGILVRREDGGPAFVRVERMGRDFRPFGMWKVRTMRAERPDGSATGA